MLRTIVLAFVLIGFTSLAVAQEPAKKSQDLEPPKVTKEKPISFWMAKKLDYSQEMLKVLTFGDFKSLETHATQDVRPRPIGRICPQWQPGIYRPDAHVRHVEHRPDRASPQGKHRGGDPGV